MERQYRKILDEEKSFLKPQLENIWKRCFLDTDEGTKFVFENIYPSVRCYVCFEDDVCCASLYLIEGEIFDKKGVLQKAHYLFGAATLPEYRKGGIMSSLIEYALTDSFKNGDKASVLLPANEKLYSYYAGLGYVPLFGTVTKEYDFSLSDTVIKKYLSNNKNKKIDSIINLRKSAKLPVQVMRFSDKTVKNALGYNRVYKGFCLSGDDFYMVIQGTPENAVITEFISEKSIEELFSTELLGFESRGKLTVRIPGYSEDKFGMIKVLESTAEFSERIYIGLTKD